jgi:hypothetical protein
VTSPPRDSALGGEDVACRTISSSSSSGVNTLVVRSSSRASSSQRTSLLRNHPFVLEGPNDLDVGEWVLMRCHLALALL